MTNQPRKPEKFVNPVNLNKLLSSKWTAVNPSNRERHFLVCGVQRDANDRIVRCELEAITSGNSYELDWRQLRDDRQWLPGWRR